MKNFTTKTLFVAAVCCLTAGVYGQSLPKKFGKELSTEPCGTVRHEALLEKKDPLRANKDEFEAWLAPKASAAKFKRMQKNGMDTNEVVTIPVVFHIIHNGDAVGENENIADAQVESQITVLNQDFRRLAGSNGYNDNPAGADMEIEFCLAKRDENGLLSTGIERYNLGNDFGFTMEEAEVIKTQTQWDPEKYLNIWVFYDIFGLAGYAQFPTASGLEGLDGLGTPITANTDGVALIYTCVGSEELYPEGSYSETRNLGRSASHEVGHFFGLRHIWGDFGSCDASDYCSDTPAALSPNSGCPVGMDSCEENDGNDMIENYMDYTNDSCLNIFTADQKDRMQAVLENSPRRVSLITSDGCVPGVVYDNDGALQIQGTQGSGEGCDVSFAPGVVLTNKGTNTITTAVISYQMDEDTAATYNFNGSLANGESATINFPAEEIGQGAHELNVYLVSVNGIADQAPGNDTKSSQFNVSSSYNTTQIIIKIMTDDFGGEVLWALANENNEDEPVASNINFNDPFNSDFPDDNALFTTTIDIDEDGCYAFFILDLGNDGICCGSGDGYYSVETPDGTVIAQGGQFTQSEVKYFGIDATAGRNDFTFGKVALYPNPANSVLNIAIPDTVNIPENYTIYNSLGQEMGSGNISGTLQSIDIVKFADGIYFIKLAKGSDAQTLQFIKH